MIFGLSNGSGEAVKITLRIAEKFLVTRKVMNIGNSSNVQLERALIYDINGRLIQTVDLGNMDREASVNVANLSSGVYLVQLEAQGATAIKRLIKE